MLGDINIGEPGALIGFAGPRVVKDTTGKDLPEGFQTSEFLLEHGFLDFISHRKELKNKINLYIDLILNQEIYKGLSENYLALNKWEEYKEFRLKYLTTQKLIKERERKSISDSLVEKKSELNEKLDNEISNFHLAYLIIFILIIVVVFFVLHRVKKAKKDIESQQNRIAILQNPKNV